MRWFLRLGLADDGTTRTSFDQMVAAPPMPFARALDTAQRVAEEMVEYAVSHCERIEPLLLGGDSFARSKVKAAFTARVVTSAGAVDYLDGDRPGTWKFMPTDWPRAGQSDAQLGKVDVIAGPQNLWLEWALALGTGKKAVARAIAILDSRVKLRDAAMMG